MKSFNEFWNSRQDTLEEIGQILAVKAHEQGLSALDDHEALALSLYEDWKDGADWDTIMDLMHTRKPEEAKTHLAVYGYLEGEKQ